MAKSYEDILREWIELIGTELVPDRATAEAYAWAEFQSQGVAVGPSVPTAAEARAQMEGGATAPVAGGPTAAAPTSAAPPGATGPAEQVTAPLVSPGGPILRGGPVRGPEVTMLLMDHMGLLSGTQEEMEGHRLLLTGLAQQAFPGAGDPMAEAYIRSGGDLGALSNFLGQFAEAPPPPDGDGDEMPEWYSEWASTYGGGAAGGGGGYTDLYPPGEYYDLQQWLMSGPETLGPYWTYLKSMLPPGGPGTAEEFYDAVSRMASPLSYEGDWADYMARGMAPATFMEGPFWTALRMSALPIGMSDVGGDMLGVLASAMPQGVAPGSEIPDFGWMSGLGAPASADLANFLANLAVGQPELTLQALAAFLQMQQEAAAPFLPHLLGPSALMGEE